MASQDFAGSIQDYDAIIKLDSKNVSAFLNKATAQIMDKHVDHATDTIKAGLKANPGN